jgi:arginyl-tRNA--protein-N-Asp/Glu arginylyltransferase
MIIHEQADNPSGSTGVLGLEHYFIDIPVGCPYGLEQPAIYHQAGFVSLDDQTIGSFFEAGYRRNGNYLYSMRCPACQSCVPIRLRPGDFKPNRNQRRVLAKNRDVTIGIAPLTMSRENLTLLNKFLRARFPQGHSSAASYYRGFFLGSVARTYEIRYRIAEKLLGVAIVDVSPDWLNAVYFYFDSDEAKRSPGTFNILSLITFCRNHGIDLLYLGYWIREVRAMSYKIHFKPNQLRINNCWRDGDGYLAETI